MIKFLRAYRTDQLNYTIFFKFNFIFGCVSIFFFYSLTLCCGKAEGILTSSHVHLGFRQSDK